MAELADALDLGSSGRPCRFNSCYPHLIACECERLRLQAFFIESIKLIKTVQVKKRIQSQSCEWILFCHRFYYMHLIFKGIFKMKVIFSVFLYFIQCLICPGEEIPYTVSRCRNLVKTALGQCYIILSIRI